MKNVCKLLGIVALPLLGANVANAGFSTINPSINPAEPTQAGVLGELLGGSFTANGLNFTNGSIVATRVDDDNDKTWASAVPVTSTVTHTSLTDTISFVGDKYVIDRGDFQFTSDPADNVDGMDHMITYVLSGGATGYVLFFEDANDLRPNSDFDYNDVAVASVASVPLPAAFAAGLMCLGGMGVARFIRRKR
jgi:hypothetical protein